MTQPELPTSTPVTVPAHDTGETVNARAHISPSGDESTQAPGLADVVADLVRRVSRLEHALAERRGRLVAVTVTGKSRPSDEQDVVAYCGVLGLPAADATYLWNKWQANNFTNGGKPVRDWRAQVRSWRAAGYFPSQKQGGVSTAKVVSVVGRREAWRVKADLEAITTEIKKLGASIPFGTSQEAERARAQWRGTATGMEHSRLCKRRDALREELRGAL